MPSPSSSVWMLLPIVLPLAMACVAFVARGRGGPGAGLLTVPGVCVAVAGLALELRRTGPLRHAVGGWTAPLGIDLHADGLSVAMLGMNALVGTGIVVYAARALAPGHGRDFFWPLWLLLWGSLNALALSGDVFNLYVAFELVGLSAVALVALGREPVARVASERYLLVSLLGSLLYLLAVTLLYAAHGGLDVSLLAARLEPSPATLLALALVTAGLALKTALVPLHGWLPPAHASAPAPASAILSALVVKASFYVLLRLSMTVFAEARTRAWELTLGALGVAAILWGSLQALRQPRVKLVVAYSTVGQLGYLFLVFPLLGTAGGGAAFAGAVFLMGAHACAKAALFLAAGNLYQALGHDRVGELRGAAAALPVTFAAFALSSVSLVGLPPSGGFLAKWLLLEGALEAGSWPLAVAIVGGGLLAAGYWARVFMRALEEAPEGAPPALRPVSPVMEWSALGLALVAVLLGLGSMGPLELLRVGVPPPLDMLGWRRP